MKILKGYTVFVLFLLFASCSAGQSDKQRTPAVEESRFNYGDKLEQAVIGTWKNNEIDVDLSTYNNTDTSFHVAVNESSWKIIMNINPIYTQIKEDGTFFTEYRDTLNQVFHTNQGIWFIDGDSLFLEDENENRFPYKILIKDNEMEMEALVDYDEDGKKDDFYFGKYIRTKSISDN